MLDTDVYVKTEAGRDEIKSRTRGLSMPVRAILLMVDGQRSVAGMRELIAGSKAPSDTLDQLFSQGLIATRDGTGGTAVPAGRPIAPPPAPPATPPPAARAFSYDGPLDLVLPTFIGADEESTPAVEGIVASAPADEPAPDRYNQLYGTMNEIVRDFLPAHRRYFFQLKIERCGTADELMFLLSDLQTALAKGRGDAFASDVIARLRSTVGY